MDLPSSMPLTSILKRRKSKTKGDDTELHSHVGVGEGSSEKDVLEYCIYFCSISHCMIKPMFKLCHRAPPSDTILLCCFPDLRFLTLRFSGAVYMSV